jgi:hypothetical protein
MLMASTAYADSMDRFMGSNAVGKLKAARATEGLRARGGARRGDIAPQVAKAAPAGDVESRHGAEGLPDA